MAKKAKTDYEKVWDLFMEDFNDDELTERYDRFKNTVKSLKDRYNEKVPAVNEALKTRATLNDMILTCAKMGIVNHEAVEKDKEIQKLLDETIPILDDLKAKWEYEEALIKKYEELSHNKLFGYWKIFKTLDKKTEPWLDWKRPYEKRII
jgi:hypothetical protein